MHLCFMGELTSNHGLVVESLQDGRGVICEFIVQSPSSVAQWFVQVMTMRRFTTLEVQYEQTTNWARVTKVDIQKQPNPKGPV